MGFQNHRGESLGGDLRVHENIERMVERHGVGLVADEQGVSFQTMVADVGLQGFCQGTGAREQKF